VLFDGWLADSIHVLPQNDTLAAVGEHFHGAAAMAMHALQTAPFWLMIAGFALATVIYLFRPALADQLQQKMPRLHRVLVNKFYVDEFYQKAFVSRTVNIGNGLWQKADAGLIDGWLVNGSARLVGNIAARVRTLQSGYLFQYAFAMIVGLIVILAIWVTISNKRGEKNMASNWPILSLLIWLPIIGGVAVLAAGEHRAALARLLALLVSAATFGLSILLYAAFDTTTAAMQFTELQPWIETFDIFYFLGVDGFSVPLILLTTFFGVLVVIAGWQVIGQEKVQQYMAAFLIMEGLMIGVFSALDALLFYVFFEAMLIPMFLVIGMWGGPRRVYATIKFFIYTFLGSVFMLVGLIYLYIQSGSWSILDWHQFPLALSVQSLAVPRVPGGVRGQDPDVAGAHVVAGRSRRGADRRLGGAGGHHAEDRRLRLHPLSACRSRRTPRPRWIG
jgi:NADH:ubiquinone oxidoreductase subunit 5 (subunit L)/multisubunit Na+/H+ antiporter MnhA subunit